MMLQSTDSKGLLLTSLDSCFPRGDNVPDNAQNQLIYSEWSDPFLQELDPPDSLYLLTEQVRRHICGAPRVQHRDTSRGV